MADIPHGPKFQDQRTSAVCDLDGVREARNAGDRAHSGTVDFSAAMHRRDQRRAELARQAAKVHYLDMPQKPR